MRLHLLSNFIQPTTMTWALGWVPSFLQGMGWINWLPREPAWETCLQVATCGSRMVLGSLGRSVGVGCAEK